MLCQIKLVPRTHFVSSFNQSARLSGNLAIKTDINLPLDSSEPQKLFHTFLDYPNIEPDCPHFKSFYESKKCEISEGISKLRIIYPYGGSSNTMTSCCFQSFIPHPLNFTDLVVLCVVFDRKYRCLFSQPHLLPRSL